MPNQDTQITGIFQSDIVIKSAIIGGMDYLRDLARDQWVLDYVWQGLLKNPLTAKIYGQAEIDQLKQWFLSTEVDVFMTPNMNEFKVPSISITLVDSSEIEATIGDVFGAEPRENIPSPISSNLSVTFNGTYNATTGVVVVPDSVDMTPFYPGMYLVNNNGASYQILQVDDGSVTIAAGLTPNLQNLTLQTSQDPAWVVDVTSSKFRETFRIGVFASTAAQLLYLHSIVLCILFRYRQSLLTNYGMDRMSISSSSFDKMGDLGSELGFSRFITLSAVTESVLPLFRFPRIAGSAIQGAPIATIIDDDTPSF